MLDICLLTSVSEMFTVYSEHLPKTHKERTSVERDNQKGTTVWVKLGEGQRGPKGRICSTGSLLRLGTNSLVLSFSLKNQTLFFFN